MLIVNIQLAIIIIIAQPIMLKMNYLKVKMIITARIVTRLYGK